MSNRSQVAATRIFEILDERGEPIKQATVSIAAPKQQPGAQEWSSRYEVRGLSVDRGFHGAFGVDGVQALDFAVNLLGSVLPGTDEAEAGRLRWAGSAYFRSAFLRVHLTPEEGVTTELGKVLAETTNEGIKGISSRHGPVTITLGYPRQAPSGLWFCPYRVTRLSLDSLWWVSGFDSMHAMQSALFLIDGFEDHATEVFKRHDCWTGSDVLGFPIVRDKPEG